MTIINKKKILIDRDSTWSIDQIRVIDSSNNEVLVTITNEQDLVNIMMSPLARYIIK